MTEIAKALKAFYGSFGIPAFTEDNVPDEIFNPDTGEVQKLDLPYITYTVPQSELFNGATHQVRVWYYGNSNAPVNAKADEIIAAIGQGVKLSAGRGYVCIYPSSPLAQMQPADDNTRIVYINLELRSYV